MVLLDELTELEELLELLVWLLELFDEEELEVETLLLIKLEELELKLEDVLLEDVLSKREELDELELVETEVIEDVLVLSSFEVVVSVVSTWLRVSLKELLLESLLITPILHDERMKPVNNANALKTRLFFIMTNYNNSLINKQ